MAELQVSKQSIAKLFGDMQQRLFIIPDYQRPYKWNLEKCETLWKDIIHFYENEFQGGADYFLGTIVSYKQGKHLEIIDGQQRITSFMLLLRAFYKKLEGMPEDDDVKGLKTQLGPCLWDTDPISKLVRDFSKIHIDSQVATDDDKQCLHHVLETGDTDPNANDRYSKNYNFFYEECSKYAAEKPLHWKNLLITILNNCIILPIECDEQATALTIFSTLNDRGMPLSDSDIFKAKIYAHAGNEEARKQFTQQWRELTDHCKQGNCSLDEVFRYYTHVLRARNNDHNKEVGLRKFYAEDEYNRLKDPHLMGDLLDLTLFWRYINTNKRPDDWNFTFSVETWKYIQCLQWYPNEFWKYPVSVFFITHRDRDDFDVVFTQLLRKLTAYLFAKFIDQPSVNAIKDAIYKSCIHIHAKHEPILSEKLQREVLEQKLPRYSYSRLTRSLILLDTYLFPGQTNLLPPDFDIEHIFPRKWQSANYNGWEKADAERYLDNFGNKMALEKKLNIQAGNGYFGQKRTHYRTSQFACAKALADYPRPDWLKEDIEEREKAFITRILTFFTENQLLRE